MESKLDNIKKLSKLWTCENSVNYKPYIPPPPSEEEFDYESVWADIIEQFGEAYINKKFNSDY